MLIKLNNLPWDEVKTPTPEFNPAGVVTEFTQAVASGLNGHIESVELHRNAYFENFDQLNYWIMSKTSITDHAYKASCWATDKVFHFIGDIF